MPDNKQTPDEQSAGTKFRNNSNWTAASCFDLWDQGSAPSVAAEPHFRHGPESVRSSG